MWKNISAKKDRKIANLEFKDLKNKIKFLGETELEVLKKNKLSID